MDAPTHPLCDYGVRLDFYKRNVTACTQYSVQDILKLQSLILLIKSINYCFGRTGSHDDHILQYNSTNDSIFLYRERREAEAQKERERLHKEKMERERSERERRDREERDRREKERREREEKERQQLQVDQHFNKSFRLAQQKVRICSSRHDRQRNVWQFESERTE